MLARVADSPFRPKPGAAWQVGQPRLGLAAPRGAIAARSRLHPGKTWVTGGHNAAWPGCFCIMCGHPFIRIKGCNRRKPPSGHDPNHESRSMSSYLFTSESVSEGHPDKVADQISDAVLDAILAQDPRARVACETMVKTGVAIVAGEITTRPGSTWRR